MCVCVCVCERERRKEIKEREKRRKCIRNNTHSFFFFFAEFLLIFFFITRNPQKKNHLHFFSSFPNSCRVSPALTGSIRIHMKQLCCVQQDSKFTKRCNHFLLIICFLFFSCVQRETSEFKLGVKEKRKKKKNVDKECHTHQILILLQQKKLEKNKSHN